MLELRYDTPPAWLTAVASDPIAFLQDHAANERKVSTSALHLAVEHPRREALVMALIEVAQEELAHFAQVVRLLAQRGAGLAVDCAHPYVGQLRRATKNADVDRYLLDRLLVFALIEARACERFGLLAEGLEDPELRDFYGGLRRAEARHHALYIGLARQYFDNDLIDARLDTLLDLEAATARQQPLRPALY